MEITIESLVAKIAAYKIVSEDGNSPVANNYYSCSLILSALYKDLAELALAEANKYEKQ